MLIAAGLIVIGGIGVGTYYLGKSRVDEDEIRAEGFDEGEDAGYDRGRDAGYETGFAAGKREGRASVNTFAEFNDGFRAGAREALSLDSFEYDPYSQYVITVKGSPTDAKWTVGTWLRMEQGESYNICPDDPLAICGGSLP